MKTKKAIAFLVLVAVLLLVGCGGEKTLTITHMESPDSQGYPTITVAEKNGRTEILPKDFNQWFTNATFSEEAPVTVSTAGTYTGVDEGETALTSMTVIFTVDGVNYRVAIENGAEFKVKSDGEGYAVIPGADWEKE